MTKFKISIYDKNEKVITEEKEGYIQTIIIPGWKKENAIKTTLHKQDTRTKLTKWVLSEYSSGYRIATGRTRKELIEKTVERFQKGNEKEIMKHIRSKRTINK